MDKKHTRPPTHPPTHAHTHAHIHAHAHAPTRMHPRTQHARARPRTHARAHAHTHTHAHARARAHARTHEHTHTAHTHTNSAWHHLSYTYLLKSLNFYKFMCVMSFSTLYKMAPALLRFSVRQYTYNCILHDIHKHNPTHPGSGTIFTSLSRHHPTTRTPPIGGLARLSR